MIIIKLCLLFLLTFLFLFFSITDRYPVLKKLVITLSFGFTVFLIIFPEYAKLLASLLNIVDPNNMILYILIGILTLIVGTLYAKSKDNRALTKIVRELAISNYVKTGDKE